MSVLITDIEQGSLEWLAMRTGIPTASNFDSIITTKGEPSKQAQKYLYQLAGERLTGAPMETYQNGAMQRGSVEQCSEYLNDIEHYAAEIGAPLTFPEDLMGSR